MSDERKTVLERLFGSGKSKLQKALEGVQAALIADGHVVKSYDGQSEKGIVEDLQGQLRDMLAPLSEDIPDDLVNTIIASVMGALAQMPSEPEPEVEVEEPVEVMADDEEEEEIPALMELATRVKALTDEVNANFEEVTALVELVPSFIAMADAVKELAPLLQKAQRIDALENELAEIKKSLSMTPRIASQDDTTQVDNPEAAVEIAKSADEYDTVLGIPVRKS